MNLTANCVRGCGTRDKGGVYLCTGTSPDGLPIELFLLDPTPEWEFHRGFRIVPNGDWNDILIYIGEDAGKGDGYFHYWQFVEEARRFGISRKVPPTFPFHQLTPGKSRMIYCHRKVIPDLQYEVDPAYSDKWCKIDDEHYCVYHGRDLSYLAYPSKYLEAKENGFNVKFPQYSYSGLLPKVIEGKPKFLPGLFMATYLTHVEFPHESNPKAEQAAQKAGYETAVTEW